MQQRMTKQELKQDEFVNKIMNAWEYVKENYPKVIAVIGGIVIVVLIGVFIKQQADEQTRASVEALGEVRIALLQGQIDNAIVQAERVAENYNGKPAAGQALHMVGNLYFDSGRYAESQVAFQSYLDNYGSEGPMGYASWSGIAACLEEQGDPAGAADKYIAFADQNRDSAFTPMALKEAARCVKTAGNTDRSIALLKRVTAEYPESGAAQSATAELKKLGVEN
jgi:TolA-binding protein